MKIIRKGQRVSIERYGLVFEWKNDPEAGFSFDCDKAGNILYQEMNPSAEENLKKCLSGDYEVIAKGVTNYSYSYFEPTQGICSCGKTMILDDFTNECSCGSLYNLCGQKLAPRSQWEE